METMEPWLARIRVYPIKSLDPREVESVRLAAGQSLAGDREYALFGTDGRFVNAKRLGPALLGIRAQYSSDGGEVALAAGGSRARFSLTAERPALAAWFSRRLGRPVKVRKNSLGGYPDDTEASGPTVVGTASLRSVADHFGLRLEEVRRRFRANLEIEGLEPFGEDLLYGAPGTPCRFRLGEVEMLGTNPCRRCSVPTRDSHGRDLPASLSASSFAAYRRRHAHPGSKLHRYPGAYRLAVNTRLAGGQANGRLRVGDRLRSSS